VSHKLLNLMRHVSEHVPYYKTLFYDKDIKFESIEDVESNYKSIPMLTKQILSENIEELISNKICQSDIVWEYTSGTSGTPLKIGKTSTERMNSATSLWKWRKTYFNISPSYPYVYFTSLSNGLKYLIEHNITYLSEIHLEDNDLDIYYNILVKQKIKWIAGSPSVLFILLNYMKDFKKEPISTLEYIELTGEQILKEEKGKIADFFKCNVAEQYGTREVWAIAKECNHGKFHIMENDVLLELNQNNGILVTSLNLYSIPIIRYYIDDVLEYDSLCDCGCNSKTIKIIKSRSLEFLHVGKTKVISPILLRISINSVIQKYGVDIKQFQYIQEDYNILRCYLSYRKLNGIDCAIIEKMLRKEINEFYKLPDDFVLEVIDYGSLNSKIRKGKLNYFLSMIESSIDI